MTFPSDDLGGDPPCWSHLTAWSEDDPCDRVDVERLLPPFTVKRTHPPFLREAAHLPRAKRTRVFGELHTK
jgi:hypothetical protein